jgi:hypothetical protein
MGNLARIALMILVGQYDSPYVRRVAISLRALDFDYEHDTRSVSAISIPCGQPIRWGAFRRSSSTTAKR